MQLMGQAMPLLRNGALFELLKQAGRLDSAGNLAGNRFGQLHFIWRELAFGLVGGNAYEAYRLPLR